MDIGERLSRIRELSDEALLEGIGHVLGANRQLVALVVAHLGEVDERRLHLIRGYGTLFAYCTGRLGMSEDEAWRRIDVARLARRFPILFEGLATGTLSLSVAALLRHRLTDSNHVELLAAVSGKTIRQAHEVLAAWFPKPDVPPSIRKLPVRGPACALDLPFDPGPVSETALGTASAAAGLEDGRGAATVTMISDVSSASAPSIWEDTVRTAAAPTAAAPTAVAHNAVSKDVAEPRAELATIERAIVAQPRRSPPARTTRIAAAISPLSPDRYRVQFTASAELKRKLELMRDLLRHAVPQGDLATIVERAVDLLLERTLQRRFAKRSKPRTSKPRASCASARAVNETTEHAVPASESSSASGAPGTDAVTKHPGPSAMTSEPSPASAPFRTPPSLTSRSSTSRSSTSQPSTSQPSTAESSRYLPAQVRRAVLERDGLRCTWRGPDGVRCESRAWLEHDHVIPWGLGGSNSTENTRIYCRAHNRLAAEQAYGRSTIKRIIARRRRSGGVRAP